MRGWSYVAAAAALMSAAPGWAVEAKRSTFGRLPDGREVAAVTLSNRAGVSTTLIAYGASIQSLILPDRAGRRADVALGHATIADYLATPQYSGRRWDALPTASRAAASRSTAASIGPRLTTVPIRSTAAPAASTRCCGTCAR